MACLVHRRLARWTARPWSRAKARMAAVEPGGGRYVSLQPAVNAASASLRSSRKLSTSSRADACSIITKRMRCSPKSRETVDTSTGVRSQVAWAARPA
jgi:hypothetical protein